MTDDNLRGLPLPIPIYFPAIPLRVTVCVTLCQDDILLTTYYIDDKMTYCWLRLLLMTWWHNVNNVLVFPAVDHHPNGDYGGKTKPKPHKHVLIEFSLLQTWEFSYFLFLISHLSFSLFLISYIPSRQSDRPSRNSGRGCIQVFWNKSFISIHVRLLESIFLMTQILSTKKNQDCNI